MKRPPGLWILLSAGFLCLCLDDVHSIRATSLIFGKSTTTTTTTTTTAQPDNAQDEEVATTEQVVDANSTKPTLTGNPQIDYVWDPNLPKELNGYNLSDYPFYERVPEDIDFKCDGLHDGFYASVKHKCQVYHHCLNGIRYDFLCANYTAFDQKTFICHFASEVDCKNSKKFWHRNDALYKAVTTTTVKPFVIYTPPPQATVINNPTAIAADVTASFARRPLIGQRPLRRRRPQYEYYDDEYYDDYYEDRLRSTRGRKRPRPRPRPIYYDDYDEEYEDDRYDWRGVRRRNEKRRPYDRKGGRRKNQDRIKDEYREDVSDGSEDEEYRLSSRRKNKDRRKEVEIFEGDDVSDDRPYKRRRPVNSEYKRLRKPFKVKEAEENESDELSRESGKTKERPIIKPISGTIYDKPRIAPKIKLPVPKHEADKYAYKPLDNEKLKQEEEEAKYYDDYEYEQFVPRSRLPAGQNSKKQRVKISGKERTSEKNEAPKSVKKPDFTEGDDIESYDDYDEAYDEKEGNSMEEDLKNDEPSTLKPISASKVTSTTVSTTTSIKTSTTSTTTTPTPTVTPISVPPTTEIYIGRMNEPLIRLVKRPFLPSRGGNPYTPRGLQPIGARAINTGLEDKSVEEFDKRDQTFNTYNSGSIIQPKNKSYSENTEVFKPSPKLIKTIPPPLPLGQNYYTDQTFEQRPTFVQNNPERNQLESEYETPVVNESRSPYVSSVPVQFQTTGYSQQKDSYNILQPTKYNLQNQVIPSNYKIIYQNTPSRQTYQIIPQTDVREQFVHNSADFKRQQFSVINQNDRPRQVQNTQTYFTRY